MSRFWLAFIFGRIAPEWLVAKRYNYLRARVLKRNNPESVAMVRKYFPLM